MATAILVTVCAVFLVVGLLAGLRQFQAKPDATDLMVAHRRLPMWMACLTLAATWIGGGYINGTAEAVYDSQLGLVWCQAPWCYALSLMAGGLAFARPMRARGYRTMLDLFEDCHGARMAGILFIPALIGDVFWTAAILSALGTTFSTLFGVDTRLAVLVSAGIVIAYTAWGGLWSVACSDVLQLACIVFGLAITLPFALHAVGGFDLLRVEYIARFGGQASILPHIGAWSGSDPWGWQWLDSALLLIFGGIPWQVYFQRILACRTPNAAMAMSLLAGLLCALVAVAPGLLGAIGACIDWSGYTVGPPPTSAQVLPHVLRYAVPTSVSLIGLMALVAAVMSSMDSSILSSASMFAWNVYRPLTRSPGDSPDLFRVLRLAVVILGGVSISLAVTVKSVYTLWYLSADLVYVILFPQLVMGLFFRGITRAGATAGLFVSVGLRLAIGSGWLTETAWVRAILPRTEYIPWLTIAMLSSVVAIVFVSWATTNPESPASSPATEGS